MAKGGRTRCYFTPERKDALLDALRKGAPVRVATRLAGIHPNTYYYWLKRGNPENEELYTEEYEEFARDAEHAIAEATLNRIQRISDAGASGSWQADAWYLERVFPDEFGRKERVEHTQQEPIKVTLSWE